MRIEVGKPEVGLKAEVESATVKSGGRPRFRPSAATLAVCVLVLAHMILAWIGRQTHILTGQDDAWYLLLSRALHDFRYVDLYVQGEPAHQLYPPGYPAALAVWSAIGGESLNWLVLLSVLSSGAAIAITFLFARRLIGDGLAILCVAALAFNPALVEWAGSIASEALFMLLSVLSVWVLLDTDTARRRGAAGAFAIAAAATRAIGLATVLGTGLHWLLQRRWRAVFGLALASLLTVGAWMGWTAVAPDQYMGKSYIADATSILSARDPLPVALGKRVLRNSRVYLTRELPSLLSIPTVPGTIADNLVILTVVAVGLSVGLVMVYRSWRPAALSLGIYLGVLLAWPWVTGRFALPLLPILLPTILLGLKVAARPIGPRAASGVAAAFALAITVNGLGASVQRSRDALACDHTGRLPSEACSRPDEASFYQALRYIEDNLPQDAVIAAAKAAPLYYYTSRRTPPVGPLIAQSNESFLDFLRTTGTGFVLLGRLNVTEARRLHPLVLANCRSLRLLATFPPSTYLFEVFPDGAPAISAAACEAADAYRSAWIF